MNKIDRVFNKKGSKALVGYITTGYPDVDTTLKAVPVMVENGCDIIELGIPFSDPIGDGPVIQQASYHALQNGINMEKCFEAASALSGQIDAPLVFMSYFNPVLHYGIERFACSAASAGISGLIVPDLPPGESLEVRKACRSCDIHLIYMLSPNSTPERIRLVAQNAGGFIYLVTITGVTGARRSFPPELPALIEHIKAATQVPLCAGFGISTPAQVKTMASITDGVIFGSRLIQLIDEDPSLKKAGQFIRSLKEALDGA